MRTFAIFVLLSLYGFNTFSQSGQIFYYPFNNGNTDNQSPTSFSTLFAQNTNSTSDAMGNANSALNFNGGNAELWVNSGGLIDFGLTTSFTFVTDFKSGSSATQYFFRDLLTNGNGWHVGILNSSGYITFEAGDGPGDQVSIHTEDIYNDNEWHQLALLVNKVDMTIQMYIDGSLSNLEASICGNVINGTSISIDGCNFNANEDNGNLTTLGDNMLGALDEIKLFSSLLTPSQIHLCYASSFIETPELNSPTNGATLIDPVSAELVWTSTTNAVSYELEIDDNPSFSSSAIQTSNSSNLNINNLNPSTTYYWRVRSITPSGLSVFSETWSFTTLNELNNAPVLLSPANNAMNLNPNAMSLVWNELIGASSYEIEYDTDISFSAPNIFPSNNTSQNLAGLESNTTYYWRVKGVNSLGESPYSSIWSFTTTASLTMAPNLVSPANNATGLPTASIPLTWEAIIGADDYTLEYDDSNAFLSPVTQNVSGTTANATTLDINTTYYWRVRASNVVGNSPFSEVWSFTTDDMTSIGEIDGQQLSIFPNPAKSILNFSANLTGRYEIFDLQGKTILSGDLINSHSISIESLAKGIYELRISTEIATSIKLIKN